MLLFILATVLYTSNTTQHNQSTHSIIFIMPTNILYTTYVRKSDAMILAEYGSSNLKGMVRKVVTPLAMQKCSPGKRIRLNTNDSAFHLIGDDKGLIVMVATSSNYPQRIVFSGMCKDLLERFHQKVQGNWQSVEENAYKTTLHGTMSALAKEYEDMTSKNKIESLKQQVAGVQEIVGDNIEKALSNLESTALLETKADALSDQAKQFENTAKKLACHEWCAMMKMWFILFAVVLVIGLIISISVCGKTTCFAASSSAPSPSGRK